MSMTNDVMNAINNIDVVTEAAQMNVLNAMDAVADKLEIMQEYGVENLDIADPSIKTYVENRDIIKESFLDSMKVSK